VIISLVSKPAAVSTFKRSDKYESYVGKQAEVIFEIVVDNGLVIE
jgi:hypothetical protein